MCENSFFRFYLIILKILSCNEPFEQYFKIKINIYKTNRRNISKPNYIGSSPFEYIC